MDRLSSRHNWYLFSLAIVLSAIGIALLFSASQTALGTASDRWQFQLVWLFLAIVVYFAVGLLPMRIVEKIAWPSYVVAIALLLVVLGLPRIAGAHSWIRLGPLQFQPSEFAKIAVILMFARWAASLESPPRDLTDLVKPTAIVAVPAALVLIQPDLGTATVFLVLLAALCFWAGTSLLLVFLLLSPIFSILLAFSLSLWSLYILAVGAVLFLRRPSRRTWAYVAVTNVFMGTVALPLWNSLKGYQQQRLLVFLRPESDPQGAGWNVIQSKVAIGSGGLLGKGFLNGTQKRLEFLPERTTDFIFSVLGEELGFVGVVFVFALFCLLLLEGVRIAERNPDPFASTVAFGLAALLGSHLTINTAMTVGLLPITGLPLPFLSKGGSFLVVCFVALALWRLAWSERFATKWR